MGLYRDSKHGESNAKMDNESETPLFMLWYHNLVLPFCLPFPYKSLYPNISHLHMFGNLPMEVEGFSC